MVRQSYTYRKYLFILGGLLLSGCTTNPQDLGISEPSWAQLSKEKQEELVNNYLQLKFNQQSPVEQAADDQQVMVELEITGGRVMMPPFIHFSAYQPAKMTLIRGSCSNVSLYTPEKANSIEFKACYYGQILYLDPSRYNPKQVPGSAQLVYSPVWKRGFTYYGVSTDGYARMKDVNIHVHQFDSNQSY